MKKRIFAIVLIVCLVSGIAFAAKGDIKVGAQAGFGTDRSSYKSIVAGNKVNYNKTIFNGFFFVATGEYDVTDAIGIKAEAGILTMGKGTSRVICKDLGIDSTLDGPEAPVNFSFYLGGQYEFEIGDDFSLAAGAGVDMMLGKQDKDLEKGNGRIGVGFEAVGSYAINNDIDVTLGARYAIYFINTNSDDARNIQDWKDAGGSVFQSGLKIFAGCTYTL
ncbi:MAG: porin family protein [Sphaerochaetaceae bacterium]|nr:porin family protein [Sphaerochaetaceae bacterium]